MSIDLISSIVGCVVSLLDTFNGERYLFHFEEFFVGNFTFEFCVGVM